MMPNENKWMLNSENKVKDYYDIIIINFAYFIEG